MNALFGKSSLKIKKMKGVKIMKNEDISQIKYSQNFLRNPRLVEELVGKSSIASNDLVYEIGPGKGIITEQLAKKCAKVIAIEKDRKLYEKLKEKFSGNQKVEIKHGDFLNWHLPRQGEYKIFSNIPFNLTADIVTKITATLNPPKDAYLIIQKEAAKKFAGLPYGKERQYSLLLKPWFEFKILYHFKNTDFYPIPQVSVVLLQIKKREEPLVEKEQARLYRDFIVYGFNQWKPTLEKSLKKIFTHEQFKRLSKNLGFERTAQPTDLTFEQWLGLFKYFLTGVEEKKKELIYGAEATLKQQQARLQKIHRTRFKK